MQFCTRRWHDQPNMLLVILHLMAFVPFANMLLRWMVNGETEYIWWLITLDHWLKNLLSASSHMYLTTKLCEVNFSNMQLPSDKQICFNASRVELNWSYWKLIALVDLWTSRILWLLGFPNFVSECYLRVAETCGW